MKGSVWIGFTLVIISNTVAIMAFPTINFPQFPDLLWLLVDTRYLLALLAMIMTIGLCVKWIFKLYYRDREQSCLVKKERKWLLWIIPFSVIWMILWLKFPSHISLISAVAIAKELHRWRRKKKEFVHF